jgi:hypothetical protein
VGRSHRGIFGGWNGIVPCELHSEVGEVELRGRAVGVRWESGGEGVVWIYRGGQFRSSSRSFKDFQGIGGSFKVAGTRSWWVSR